MGLNAVRVPFGYWVVLGSLRASPGRKREDPYKMDIKNSLSLSLSLSIYIYIYM